MKRLWSPWRSQYIQTFSEPSRRSRESLFRTALRSRDDRKNLVVWRGKHCFVIMNRYPYNSGHLMVVPNRQVADVQRLTRAELAEIMQAVQRAMKALGRIMHPQGFNFGANFGRTAGAGIAEHVHFHVVPRWDGDTNFMPVLGDTKVISEDMDVTWNKLRKLL